MKSNRWRQGLCGAMLAACAVLVACSGGASRVEQGNAEGVLHFGNGTEPETIDPHVATGVPESRLMDALLEGLTLKDPATLGPLPGMAESWEISPDGLTYRFRIREDARWSDGTPLTAEDFRWSWWRALEPAMGNQYNYMLFTIRNAEAYATGKLTDFSQVGVRVVEPQLLEVELNAPTPYFLQLIAHASYFPVPRHVIEKFGAATDRASPWTRPGNMVGNGPFTLSEWELNKHVRVEKSPTYWDAENVRLNAVMYYPTENEATEERMFRSGQLHMTNSTPIDKVSVYREEDPEQLRVQVYLGTYYYRMNLKKPGLDDVRVRKALSMAVDRQTLVDTVLEGIYMPAWAMTPPGTLGYEPPKLFEYDPEGARKLLAEAGYPEGRGLPPLEILYNTNELHRKIAVALQQMWKQNLNIDVTMVNQEWKVYLDTTDSFEYTIGRAGWIGDYVDPNSFLDLWITDGGNNKTGWSNAEYDELILRTIPAMKSHEERLAGFHRAETLLMQDMPVIPIYTYVTRHLVRGEVKGLPKNILDYYSFKDIYLEPER